MEALAADLWNPLGGYLPAKATANSNTMSHTVSACEIQTVLTAELQMGGTDITLRSHNLTLSNVGISHADNLNVGSERAQDLTSPKVECTHDARTRSHHVQVDRGPNGHLHQPVDAEL